MSRRAILSSSVVVALAGFFVFAGAVGPAAADPVVLTVTPANVDPDRTPYFEGTGTPDAALELFVQSGQTCETTIAANGTWACEFVSLPIGYHQLGSTQTPLVGSPETNTALLNWWVDGPLPTPTITDPVDGGYWSNDPVWGAGGGVSWDFDSSDTWGLIYGYVSVTVDGVTSPYCSSTSRACYSDSIGNEGEEVIVSVVLDWYGFRPSSPSTPSAPVGVTLYDYRWTEILTAPSSPAPDRNLHFAGVATANSPLELRDDDGTVICSTTVDLDENWTCDIVGPLPGGDYVITAYTDTPFGWVDQSSPEVLLTVIPGPDPDPGPEPEPEPNRPPDPAPPVAAPAPTPVVPKALPPRIALDWSLDLGGVSEYAPGDTVTLTGRGLPEGASVAAELHSTPVTLGSASAGPEGFVTISSTIPSDIEPGAHSLVVTASADNADASTISVPITVVPASTPAAEDDEAEEAAAAPSRNSATVTTTGPATDPTTTGPGSTAWETADRTDPASPSALTESLATVSYLWANPIVLGVSAVVALVLLLFVAFPAELLNSTLSEQYDRMIEARRARAPQWWTDFRATVDRVPVLSTALFVVVAAVIFGFIDPRFGFDIVSLRVVLACAIGLIILALGANYLTAAIAWRAWGLRATIDLRPFGLVLAIVGVAISRALEFLPGIMIGVFAGLVLLGTNSGTSRLRVTIVRAMVVWGVAVASWIGYSVVAEPLVGTSLRRQSHGRGARRTHDRGPHRSAGRDAALLIPRGIRRVRGIQAVLARAVLLDRAHVGRRRAAAELRGTSRTHLPVGDRRRGLRAPRRDRLGGAGVAGASPGTGGGARAHTEPVATRLREARISPARACTTSAPRCCTCRWPSPSTRSRSRSRRWAHSC